MNDAKDPVRWSDPRSGASSFEGQLLREARAAAPPPGLKAELLPQLLARAKAASAAAVEAPSLPKTNSPAALPLTSTAPHWAGRWVRIGAVGLASGALLLGLRGFSESPLPPEPGSVVALPTQPDAVPLSETFLAPADPPPEALADPPPEAPADPLADPPPERAASEPARVGSLGPAGHASSTPESRLREESLLILRARERLRGGDPAGALRILAEARSRFPEGALGQEREALTIEALAAEKDTAAARAHADEFLRDNPDSPHGARVRALTDDSKTEAPVEKP